MDLGVMIRHMLTHHQGYCYQHCRCCTPEGCERASATNILCMYPARDVIHGLGPNHVRRM